MTYEVELKFRLPDPPSVADRLRQLGAVAVSVMSHVDRYFNHPSRNFRETDEAFRIRSMGDGNCLTYKGPVIGNVAKTRHEIEVAFATGPGQAEKMVALVKLLGFRFVRDVRKTRHSMTVDWNGRHYELAMDEVPPLGQFLEIELLVEDDKRPEAEKAVWDLAHTLGLNVAEPKSYLNMLLELE